MDKEGYSPQVEAAAAKIHDAARLTLGEVPSDVRPMLARFEMQEKLGQMDQHLKQMDQQAQRRYVPERRR